MLKKTCETESAMEKAEEFIPVEDYEAMLDKAFSEATSRASSHDKCEWCNTVARMAEIKLKLGETRRFRDAMEIAEKFRETIEKDVRNGNSVRGDSLA